MTWLEFAPSASIVISITAAFVSAWAVNRAIYNANRQFAQSYVEKLGKWASEVLTQFRITSELFDPERLPKDISGKLGDAINGLIQLLDQSAFLLPRSAAPLVALEAMICELRLNYNSLHGGASLVIQAAEKHRLLREAFIAEVRSSLYVERTYHDARRYLSR